MLKNLEVRKFMAVLLLIAYIVFMAFIVGYAIITGTEAKIPSEFAAFTGMVGLVVGQYFGKSTMAEGSKMNKDP